MQKVLKSAVKSPWFSSVALVAAMLGSSFVHLLPRLYSGYALAASYFLAVAAVAASVYGISARTGSVFRSVMLTMTPVVLAAAGLGLFLVIDSPVERWIVGLSTVGFSAAYVTYLRGVIAGSDRFSSADFAHVSAAMHAIGAFLAFAFALASIDYLRAPFWSMVVALSIVLYFMTRETFLRSGMARKSWTEQVAVLALSVLGVQLFVSLSFLPTSYVANSAVGSISYATALHATIDVLSGRAEERALSRQLVAATIGVILILATARWL